MDHLSTPSPNNKNITLSKTKLSRAGSMRSNKGIGLNLAISPINNNPSSSSPSNQSLHRTRSNSSNTSATTGAGVTAGTSTIATPELKYDVAFPPASELQNLDIEEQLRLLALKEMSVVEIKDCIANLNNKLQAHEKELQKLRQLIQRLLYNQIGKQDVLKNQRPRQNSSPRDEAILNSKKKEGLWSNLSKPLELIQQFDTMLQNEFEKSLIIQEQKSHKSRPSEDSNSSTSSIPSPLKSKSSKSTSANLNDLLEDETTLTGSDDMIQNVSSSIWSFVNEVKSNVLNSLNEEDKGELLYKLENGSNVSLENGSNAGLENDSNASLEKKKSS